MFLPDINVWVALAFELHPQHTAANTWYEASSETCCFCRLTQQGFLRLARQAVVVAIAEDALKKWAPFAQVVKLGCEDDCVPQAIRQRKFGHDFFCPVHHVIHMNAVKHRLGI